MSGALSCSCDMELEPGCFTWRHPKDFIPMPLLSRRKRCASCKEFIAAGSDVLRFTRRKVPETEVEIKIYGEDFEPTIPLADWYLCEKCGEIYFNLYEAGYECIDPREVLDAQAEYWELTGFDPKKYQEIA